MSFDFKFDIIITRKLFKPSKQVIENYYLLIMSIIIMYNIASHYIFITLFIAFCISFCYGHDITISYLHDITFNLRNAIL